MIRFAISDGPIDAPDLSASLANPEHGGFCAFEGRVRARNDGRRVDGLEYEIYAELAQAEGERILAEARQRFGPIDACGVHRGGRLKVGDLAVWVGVSAAHRDATFRACRYVVDQLKHRLPVWKKEHYLDGDAAWVACHHEVPSDKFVPDYSRQTRLRDVGEAGQARLAAAKVLVIGAGGLGSPVLAYLAGAGVGRLGIVDDDAVEASNLHRQTLYAAPDVGHPKAEAAARRVAAINPTVEVEVFSHRLDPGNVVDTFSRFDLAIECTDDVTSRYLSNDAAILAGIPLILASVYQYEGQLQVIGATPGEPCLRCLWPDPPMPDGGCAASGVLGPVPGVLGAMQANEALKILLGFPQPGSASLLLVDLLDNTTQRLAIEAHRCAERGGCAEVARRALAAARADAALDLEFPSWSAAMAAGFHLVDIREPDETAAEPAPVAMQRLPIAELQSHLARLPAGAPILLVCASGRRSGHAARRLRARGVGNVFSLSGGIDGFRSKSRG